MNGIPSSCRNKACSFHFQEDATPVITSISPRQGQGGSVITIQGRTFGQDPSALSVEIGGSECLLESATDSVITCTAAPHVAGTYRVSVTLHGIGRALTDFANSNDTACFTYLLTLDTVTPEVGGLSGGYVVRITGEGFLGFDNVPNTFFESQGIANLPWFRFGIGLPALDRIRDLELCPGLEEEFQSRMQAIRSCFREGIRGFSDDNGHRVSFGRVSEQCSLCAHEDCEEMNLHWRDLISGFPSAFTLGPGLCIVVEADLYHVTCIAIHAVPGQTNVTGVVFDQRHTLVDVFTPRVDLTPTISGVSPNLGPVTGDTDVIITGSGFMLNPNSTVNVTMGYTRCHVTSVNSTHILCSTGPHPPGFVPLVVSTESGVAILESALVDGLELSGRQLFPLFRYKLVVTGDAIFRGSVVGGTEVLIPGGIFVEGETEVYVGERQAEIVSIGNNSIAIVIPQPDTTKTLHLIIIPVYSECVDDYCPGEWDRNIPL